MQSLSIGVTFQKMALPLRRVHYTSKIRRKNPSSQIS